MPNAPDFRYRRRSMNALDLPYAASMVWGERKPNGGRIMDSLDGMKVDRGWVPKLSAHDCFGEAERALDIGHVGEYESWRHMGEELFREEREIARMVAAARAVRMSA